MGRRWINGGRKLIAAGLWMGAPLYAQVSPSPGRIELRSSFAPLQDGFAWAKTQSLAYAFDRGDPVGPWYEAALPGREAFCMRDVSHQLTGGLALGLMPHTRNMLAKFAASIAESRQWAGYWEIDRLDRPAPVDYRSDADFWYNLPANFDVVDAAERAYAWTGDRTYVDDPAFREFYRRSLSDYVAAWDPDGDGVQESGAEAGYRGIPTYWEGEGPRALTGGDLVAAQYAANRAYAAILRAGRHAAGGDGDPDLGEADRVEAEAARLRRLYNDGWWNETLGRFQTAEIAGEAFDTTLIPLLQILPVYYGIVEPGPRRERLLDAMPRGKIVEVNVYLAEAFYRAGRNESAFAALMEQMDPALPRREYPENPFTAVGTSVRWLAGVEPRASEGVVETLPRLPSEVGWVELEHVPTFAGEIGVRHDGNGSSRFTNEGETPVRWRAAFHGRHAQLSVDGATTRAAVRVREDGGAESFVELLVAPGQGVAVTVPPQPRTFRLGGHELEVVGDLNGFDLSVETRRPEEGVEIAHVLLRRATPAPPPPFSLRWSLPSADIRGQWNPAAGLDKTISPDWAPSEVRSALARHAPVMALFGTDDGNRLTWAVADALEGVTLQSSVREEDARIHGAVHFFTERHRDVDSLALELRFDTRRVPYFQALGDVARWWEEHPGYTPASVPDEGRMPMYSSWYSYHQDVSPQALLPEVEAAKALGYESIIVDDGWQTLDSRRGYAYTGDWEPERIPDMKGFVDAVHERGMKFILWYAVPLVGEKSDVYPRFRGKYLRYWDGQGAWELDPRYPDVRAHVIETYRTAIRAWGVDGFKLDFLGRFVANEQTVLEVGDGRDYASVNEATDRLMTDILNELRAVKPDVMIEFRQPYAGPKMRTYGNLLRATDSPNSAVANRVRTLDLRLVSRATPVHSDMLMWSVEEPVEAAALQFLNVIFSVPQISVRLAEIPGGHVEMVRHYTAWWRENRDVLLAGVLEPHDPLANYPLVMARSGRKLIAATFSRVVVPLSPGPWQGAVDVLNATATDRVILDVGSDMGPYIFRVLDSRGHEMETGAVGLDEGAHTFTVPPGGMLTLEAEAEVR
ncbi:MAG TPA: alpha-galactosidase [Longimicrobiales bacterium]|nr:alpha-galactosidase [Longimicrobiales bacterium]